MDTAAPQRAQQISGQPQPFCEHSSDRIRVTNRFCLLLATLPCPVSIAGDLHCREHRAAVSWALPAAGSASGPCCSGCPADTCCWGSHPPGTVGTKHGRFLQKPVCLGDCTGLAQEGGLAWQLGREKHRGTISPGTGYGTAVLSNQKRLTELKEASKVKFLLQNPTDKPPALQDSCCQHTGPAFIHPAKS